MVMYGRKHPRLGDAADGYIRRPDLQGTLLSYNDKLHADRAQENMQTHGNNGATAAAAIHRNSQSSPHDAKLYHRPAHDRRLQNSPSDRHRQSQSNSSSNTPRETERNNTEAVHLYSSGDWSEYLSSTCSGKKYYYNSKTEKTQWEKPKGWSDKECILKEVKNVNKVQRPSSGGSSTDYHRQHSSSSGGGGAGGGSNNPSQQHARQHKPELFDNHRHSHPAANSAAAVGANSNDTALPGKSSQQYNHQQELQGDQPHRDEGRHSLAASNANNRLHQERNSSVSPAATTSTSSTTVAPSRGSVMAAAEVHAAVSSVGSEAKLPGLFLTSSTNALTAHQALQQVNTLLKLKLSKSSAVPVSQCLSSPPATTALSTTMGLSAAAVMQSDCATTPLSASITPTSIVGAAVSRGNALPSIIPSACSVRMPAVVPDSALQLHPQLLPPLDTDRTSSLDNSDDDEATGDDQDASQMHGDGASSREGSVSPTSSSCLSREEGGGGGGGSSNLIQPMRRLTPSLSNHFRRESISHLTGWISEHREREMASLERQSFNATNGLLAEVACSLKSARSSVRTNEIKARLNEHRLLSYDQRIAALQNLQSRKQLS